MTAADPSTEDIPPARVNLWLPAGWLALPPSEAETVIQLLRNYSDETYGEHGVPAVMADVMADRLADRQNRGDVDGR